MIEKISPNEASAIGTAQHRDSRWDEMWDGVLHATPSPNFDHQDIAGQLYSYLLFFWMRTGKGKVAMQFNVASPGDWTKNYRVPDVVLWSKSREQFNRGEYIQGPPSVVVEVRSPGDESYEKLGFYRDLGVPEVWVVDRDSKRFELHRLIDGQYSVQTAAAGGAVISVEAGISIQATERQTLIVQVIDKPATALEIPSPASDQE